MTLSPPVTWQTKHHGELSVADLYAILKLRSAVFVVEQNCVYNDIDGLDMQGDTLHVMAWQDDRLEAYLRLLDPARNDGHVVIGRVVTDPSARGSGLGHELMVYALDACARRWPQVPIYLSAQAHLQGYYGRYDFVACTDIYLEDGIEHIGMRRS
ncbi:GNAT family N-acetyltransferase [Pseudomonas sp. S9]|uniref:GNAT family N-acetyltransferase n=1 Tax=Pseudomonas sp. S9 TaxID=686578 RepID=UPI00025572AE|nr:GNAT family N-acetyltransferase [Pseudomonas sp. S9]